jgi:hypothetical protein
MAKNKKKKADLMPHKAFSTSQPTGWTDLCAGIKIINNLPCYKMAVLLNIVPVPPRDVQNSLRNIFDYKM